MGVILDKSVVSHDLDTDEDATMVVYSFNYHGNTWVGSIRVSDASFENCNIRDNVTIRFLPRYPHISRPVITIPKVC